MIPPRLPSLKKHREGTSPSRKALLTQLAAAESKLEQKKPQVSSEGCESPQERRCHMLRSPSRLVLAPVQGRHVGRAQCGAAGV